MVRVAIASVVSGIERLPIALLCHKNVAKLTRSLQTNTFGTSCKAVQPCTCETAVDARTAKFRFWPSYGAVTSDISCSTHFATCCSASCAVLKQHWQPAAASGRRHVMHSSPCHCLRHENK
jgi:hypothetical protein